MTIFNNAIRQNSVVSIGNTTTTPLGAHPATFTGTAESTLGYSCIRLNFRADQVCTVKVQQGPAADLLDVEDSWQIISGALSQAVQIVGEFFRVVVTNDASEPTTITNLQTLLLPIGEALPRSLGSDGGLKVEQVGSLGGDLSGELPDPIVVAVHSGDERLAIASGIGDGHALMRKGDTIDAIEGITWDSATRSFHLKGWGASDLTTGGVDEFGDESAPLSVGTGHANANSGKLTLDTGSCQGSSGDIDIGTGGSQDLTGHVHIASGTGENVTGDVELKTGDSYEFHSGALNIATGSGGGSDGAYSGSIGIKTGDTQPDNVNNSSGNIEIQTGTSPGAPSGGVSIGTGTGNDSGSVSVATGGGSSTNTSGGMGLTTGDANVSGSISIASGGLGADSHSSGGVSIATGDAEYVGDIDIHTGSSEDQGSGVVSMKSGSGHTSSGAVTLGSGNSDYVSGAVSLTSGSGNESASGSATLASGHSNNAQSGDVDIHTGGSSDVGTGKIGIQTGDAGAGGHSGAIAIQTGTSSDDGGGTGNIDIKTGDMGNSGAMTSSGAVTIKSGNGESRTGDVTLGSGDAAYTGAISVKSGYAHDGSSGTVTVGSGNSDNDSGNVVVQSGLGNNASSGDVTVASGHSNQDNSGNVYISTGTSDDESTGKIAIQTGQAGAEGDSGDIDITCGDAPHGQAGSVHIDGGQSAGGSPSSTVDLARAKASQVRMGAAGHLVQVLINDVVLNAPISGTFVNGDLVSGVLTVTHNWGLTAPYPVFVAIFDNTNKQVLPSQVTGATNSVQVDLSSFGTLTGTWGYRIGA